MNGKPKDAHFKHYTAYVQQFDSLLPTLTVRETLLYSGRLSLPATVTAAQRDELAGRVLGELGLEPVAHRWVGGGPFPGVSSGQRKRVSMGIALMQQPSLVFLDEPTTGLDASSAYNVMEKISRMADKGRTVVATIHQPSAAMVSLYDKLLLLSAGRVVYLGPAADAATFFESVGHGVPDHVNPSDHYLDLISVDYKPEGVGEVDIPAIVDSFAASDIARRMGERAASGALPDMSRIAQARAASPPLRLRAARCALLAPPPPRPRLAGWACGAGRGAGRQQRLAAVCSAQ